MENYTGEGSMNSNDICKVRSYKDAQAVYENVEWTEIESALLYYWYFGEERLADDLRESLENTEFHKEFVSLVNKLKGKRKYKLVEEPKAKKGWLDGMSENEAKSEIARALNILHEVEDKTNYEIKPLGKAITLLMGLNLSPKQQKENKKFKNKELV